MEYHKDLTPFNSRTLSKFFTQLDNRCEDMEEAIEFYKEENLNLQKEIASLHNQSFNAANMMMAKSLMSCFDDSAYTDDPATATLLSRIYEMPDIEAVRAYIDNVKSNSLERIEQ